VIDLAAFRATMRSALARSRLDPDEVAALFAQVQSVSAELQKYRDGAQRRTLDEASRLRALDCALSDELTPAERIAALMARTGFGRSKVYRLLELARSPIQNGIPRLNGTGDR
jgi:hypothetical protein